MDAQGLYVHLPYLPLPQRLALLPLLSASPLERFEEQAEVARCEHMPSADTTRGILPMDAPRQVLSAPVDH